MKQSQNPASDLNSEKRNALLAALARAQGEDFSPASSREEPDGEGNCYYFLTKEELTALLSGNMEKIESWVGGLDRIHATRLLRWLIKENS
ncbi:MAG TPA: hypothetical protein VMB24_01355 [Dehalococcoidales bacterium]|nr:hypothetical protein [Dehalococcoidales bacterium]